MDDRIDPTNNHKRPKLSRRGKQLMIGIYIRVSTSKQETRSQRRAIATWCVTQRYPKAELIEYLDDGVSGKTTDRPAFKRMMQDARAGKIDRVLTFELSRLSRNLLDLLDLMRALTDCGVAVEVPGDGPVKFDNTMQQFLVAAKGLAAAEERDRISTRTKAGLQAASARGVKLGAPKGSRNRAGKLKDYRGENGKLVDRILAKHAKGNSTYQIAEDLDVSRSKVVRIIGRYRAT